MEHGLVLLLRSTGDTNDMQYRDMFGERCAMYDEYLLQIHTWSLSSLPPAIPFIALSSPTPKLRIYEQSTCPGDDMHVRCEDDTKTCFLHARIAISRVCSVEFIAR